MSKLWQLINLTVNWTYSEIVPYVQSFLNVGSWTRPCSQISKESCHLFQTDFSKSSVVAYLHIWCFASIDQGSIKLQTNGKKQCLQLQGRDTSYFSILFPNVIPRIQQRSDCNTTTHSTTQSVRLFSNDKSYIGVW